MTKSKKEIEESIIGKVYDVDTIYGWLKSGITGPIHIKGGFEVKIHRNVVNLIRVWRSGTGTKREILLQVSSKTYDSKFIAKIIEEAYNDVHKDVLF